MAVIKNILKNKVMRGAYLAWLSVAIFYFYQYILRAAPGIMFDQIKFEFGIIAEEFSTLGSIYLLAYALLQIPLGVIVDKYGVKKTVITSILLCSIGSFMFGYAKEFWVAQIARFLIGAGSASAFMCSLKIISDHFIPGNRGFLMGATLTFGTVGGFLSGRFVIAILNDYNWRAVYDICGCIGIAIMVLMLLLIKSDKDKKENLNTSTLWSMWREVLKIMGHKQIMLYAFLAIGLYTPLSVLSDLWGTAFLQQKFLLSQADAANIALTMLLGVAIGSIILPGFAEKNNILNESIIICCLAILVIISFVLYSERLEKNTLQTLLFLLGFFCGAEMMCFTGALQFASKKNSGEIIGVVNTLNMMGGAILQQFIGFHLDLNWSNSFDVNGNRFYSSEQFVHSLSALTIVIGVCVLASMSLKRYKKLR